MPGQQWLSDPVHRDGAGRGRAGTFWAGAALNTVPCFAGHCDCRLPNYKELTSILNLGDASVALSPALNTDCVTACTVTTCSCTAATVYWSSSTNVGILSAAWSVNFDGSDVTAISKILSLRMRAVRGGL